jgi:putative methyltransferase
MSFLYQQAATVLSPFITPNNSNNNNNTHRHRPSLKSLTVQTVSNQQHQRMVSLLAHETLKHVKLFQTILLQCGIQSMSQLINNEPLGYILMYELLLGQGKIRGGGQAKQAIMAKLDEFKYHLNLLHRVPDPTTSLVPNKKRRYGRINTFLVSNPLSLAKSLQVDIDPHLRNVISTEYNAQILISSNPFIRNGQIILQDRASCFPAEALVSELEQRKLLPCDVIDATAAPGNKTTQVASLVIPKGGKIFAFDRSPERFLVLNQRILEAGVVPQQSIITRQCDFSMVNPTLPEFANVRAILLDPSCSGSGLSSVEREFERENGTTANDDTTQREGEKTRLLNLASFQIRLLTHALRFPQVDVVSYSTCSIHEEENEQVIKHVLDIPEIQQQWELIPTLSFIQRRGISSPSTGLTPEQAQCLVRADPVLDDTHGFFVALFGRKKGKRDPLNNNQPSLSTTKINILNRNKRAWFRFIKTRRVISNGRHLYIVRRKPYNNNNRRRKF